MDLTIEKKDILRRINESREKLSNYLDMGIIKTNDIKSMLSIDKCYNINNIDSRSLFVKRVIEDIFYSPFILCDQDNLDVKLKAMLPLILIERYLMELEEIKSRYKLGYISENEINKEKELLYYTYFETTEDGKYIKEYGKCKNIPSKKMK